MTKYLARGFCIWLLGFLALSATAQPVQRLGALGDSLSDEYLEESYSYARAWSEILVSARGLSFGPTAAQAGVGNWGEPRRRGYEDNWARFGSTTQGQIDAGAHLGLAQGASARGVSHAVIWSGGNDFSPWAGVYSTIYQGSFDERALIAWTTGRLNNLRTMLEALRPTPVRPVLASIMDFSAMPFVVDNFSDVAGRQRVGLAMGYMRDGVRALAQRESIVFLDLHALQRDVFGPADALRGTLLLGNVPIALRARDTAGTVPQTGWVEDGIHPNTTVQALTANAVLAALNTLGAGIAPLSEAQMLAAAGIAYGGADTLSGNLAQPASYVQDFRQPPSGSALRFFGNGTNTIDRVVIPLDGPARPVDVGSSSFTLEFWFKANLNENGSAQCASDNDSWINGNILIDRDVFGAGDSGDYGVSLMNGRLAFGVSVGNFGVTACGTALAANGAWRHAALVRDAGSGLLRIWLDGMLDAEVMGPLGDVSYRDGRNGMTWDPYLVLGAEKHDAGSAYPSFSGWLDDVRVSRNARYDTPFARPGAPHVLDAQTVALYRFDEGAGDFVGDIVAASDGPSHGQRRFGGAPAGPLWTADTPFANVVLFANGFEN